MSRLTGLIGLGIIVAAVAVGCASKNQPVSPTGDASAGPSAQEEMIHVLVARVDLAAGHRLDVARDTQVSTLAKRLIPKDADKDLVGPVDMRAVNGLELNQPVSAGGVIRFFYFRRGPSN